MDHSGIAQLTWDITKKFIEPGDNISNAQNAVFPAARELWRLVLTTTLCVIRVESLRRMDDLSLLQEVHSQIQDPVSTVHSMFRSSLYQHNVGGAENSLLT